MPARIPPVPKDADGNPDMTPPKDGVGKGRAAQLRPTTNKAATEIKRVVAAGMADVKADAEPVEHPHPLQDAVKQNRRAQLEAIRDYIAYQLEVHLCKTCLASRLRTGDQASLITRLMKVLEELEEISDGEGSVTSLEDFRLGLVGPERGADASDISLSAARVQHRTRSNRSGQPRGA